MEIQRLNFSRDWNNPSDFPTLETDELKVRSDMQSLHNETLTYLNNTLIPAVEAMSLNKTTVISVTLKKNSWGSSKTQTVAAAVSADETKQLIQVIPASASQTEYLRCGVLCSAQKDSALVFTTADVPTKDLTVYAVVTEVSV